MKKKEFIIFVFGMFILSRIFFLSALSRDSLLLFDSHSYIKIAKYGYTNNSLYAFFPLYPLLIKIVHIVIPSYSISGMIISNVSILIAIFLLCSMVKEKKFKNRLVLLFLFSPILCFCTVCYTESLYLLLTILSFYYYKKNKFLSGIFVGLSMLTRNTGIILLGAYMLELLLKWYKKKTNFKEIMAFVLPAFLIGFLYSVYLFIRVKNPFYYISVQSIEWGRVSCNMFSLIIKDVKFMLKYHVAIYLVVLNWFFVLFSIFYSLKIIKKDLVSSIYVLVSVILFTSTCRSDQWSTLPSIGIFRYIFSLFPIYLFFVNNKTDRKLYIINIIVYVVISLVNSFLFYKTGFIG